MTRIGQSIVDEAAGWVQRQCVETRRNGGSCIDDLQRTYWGNTSREPYCAVFVWVVVDGACANVGIRNLLPKTAGALDMLNRSKGVLPVDDTPTVGAVFYRRTTAQASGHMGVVMGSDDQYLYTAEGNAKDRIDMFQYPWATVRNAANGWKFIHTEQMPGGEGTNAGTVLSAGIPLPIVLGALGIGAGWFAYRQGWIR